MNEITPSISVFSIWLPVLQVVGTFLYFIKLVVQFEFFVNAYEYDPLLRVWFFCFDFSILKFFDPLVDRLNLLLTVVWKVILIYSFWLLLQSWSPTSSSCDVICGWFMIDVLLQSICIRKFKVVLLNHCLIWPNNLFIDRFILQVVEFLGFSLFYSAFLLFLLFEEWLLQCFYNLLFPYLF